MKKKPSNRGNGRDARGRWTKGTSGNLNGRPPNVPDLDMADVYNFSHFPTEITIAGEKQLMTRHEIMLLKAYESALKGRVTNQKYLIEKFEQADLSKEYVSWQFEKWAELIAQDPSSVSPDVKFWMKNAMNSGRPLRSTIRTRKGGKPKRK